MNIIILLNLVVISALVKPVNKDTKAKISCLFYVQNSCFLTYICNIQIRISFTVSALMINHFYRID
ncbi:hypothetical protein APD01_13595 [Acinetobacter soli]|nr:hypothetical protein APD01_13595 [Acinetobacter soli]